MAITKKCKIYFRNGNFYAMALDKSFNKILYTGLDCYLDNMKGTIMHNKQVGYYFKSGKFEKRLFEIHFLFI
jgi:hypothetical protein